MRPINVDEAFQIVKELAKSPENVSVLVEKANELLGRMEKERKEMEDNELKWQVDYMRCYLDGACPICGADEGKFCKSPDGTFGAHIGRRSDGWQMSVPHRPEDWHKASRPAHVDIKIVC